MIILIQGWLINTQDILKIGGIGNCDDGLDLCFEIVCINNKYSQFRTNNTDKIPYKEWAESKNKEIYEMISPEYSKYLEEMKLRQGYKDALENITKGWRELVDLWSENQSTIPKIEF